MILLPAIDIRGGNAVRLEKGDFAKETVYDADPLDAARKWVEAGAGPRPAPPDRLWHPGCGRQRAP